VHGQITWNVDVDGTESKYAVGFTSVVNGAAAANSDGGAVPGAAAGVTVGALGAELYQFNTFANTGDSLLQYEFADAVSNPPVPSLVAGGLMLEWVGLPTSGLTGYSAPYGTVVASPQAAAPFPPGPGTTLSNGISAGATSVTVASSTGMVPGGTLGLDYTAGTLYQPVAEPVSITSVAGTTIGITATSYAHATGAPVAVPVSAAFLNQQSRDIINFLAYPPLLRAAGNGTTQSLPTQTFPAGTQITHLAASIDTFGGFASNEYTVPISGCYLVYGQVYMAGSTHNTAYSAGIQVNSGTIQWGTAFFSDTSSGAVTLCPTFERVLRLNAGDTVQLFGTQSSASAMNTVSLSNTNSRLIMVWRSF
jgi:hypothetical protein